MASPGEHTKQSPISAHDNMDSSVNTIEHLHITSSLSMESSNSSAATSSLMTSSGECTQQCPASTQDSMLSPFATTTGSGPSQRPPPTFNGLPTELKKLVVHHTEDSCLANLRLTSKELNAIATKPFGERMLAERRFMLSEYSLKALIDLTGHPVFGPCVRKIHLNSFDFSDNIENWLKTSDKTLSKARRKKLWRQIQNAKQKLSTLHKTMRSIMLLTWTLSNLKRHGQQITFGIFDDVIVDGKNDFLRKAYGFNEFWGDIRPEIDLTHEQWVPGSELTFMLLEKAIDLSGFPTSPWELDLYTSINNPISDLDQLLNASLMTRDGKLKSNVNIYIKAGMEWRFRFFRPDVSYDRFIFDFQGTTIITREEVEVEPEFIPQVDTPADAEPRYNYGFGTCSLYFQRVLGQVQEAIAKANLSEIRISSCATRAPYLAHTICELGKENLERLVLVDIHVFAKGSRGFVDEKNAAWPYLSIFRDLLVQDCPNLRSLVMERVVFQADNKPGCRSVIVNERREWKGVSQVFSGLALLISEMTRLDEEQRDRWFQGEIDADGNDVTESGAQ
ncbi:hypothetical protein KCU92_g4272, partial [Aureobasidium melanogenum]